MPRTSLQMIPKRLMGLGGRRGNVQQESYKLMTGVITGCAVAFYFDIIHRISETRHCQSY